MTSTDSIYASGKPHINNMELIVMDKYVSYTTLRMTLAKALCTVSNDLGSIENLFCVNILITYGAKFVELVKGRLVEDTVNANEE
ncbi:hypothetical protein Tco_0044284 [Tanacetum coccineum]